jgi:aminoglycoside/choline kinase family phosphotransferase
MTTGNTQSRIKATGDNIDRRIAAYLDRLHLSPLTRVKRLHGDASNRSYARITKPDGSSFVLAVHAQPFGANVLPQIRVGAIFSHLGIPIPEVLDQADDLGILGDVTLQSWIEVDSSRDPTSLYREAVSLIVKIQNGGAARNQERTIPFTLTFDTAKLNWELDFFRSEFLETYRDLTIEPAVAKALRCELSTISTELAAEPKVLCHRDFHSRNLMVLRNRLVVIDFQDARMGPSTYDLVSLLRDCYVELPQSLVANMIAYFLDELPASQGVDFQSRFDLMSVQRHLKALGTFGYQISQNDRPEFAAHLPRTLRYLRKTLHAQRRFDRLLELLAPLIPELV